MIQHKTKVSTKLSLVFAYLILAISPVFFLSSTALAAPIADVNEAAEVCRSQLPDGSANVSFNYCAYTAPGAASPCVVASAGSFPDFGDTCVTLSLDAMVGQEPADVVAWANAGGGVSTQPAPTAGAPLPDAGEGVPIDCDDTDLSSDNCTALGYLVAAINIATASVVIVIVGSIIFAGIQYSSARDDPQAIGKAKHRILMAVIALAMFIFGYTILQWVIPGGILN